MSTFHTKPFLLLISLGLIWSFGFVIAKFCTLNGVPPIGYSFWQSVGPAVCLTILAFLKDKKDKWLINKKHIYFFFICGLIGIAIPNSIMYLAAPKLPSGIVGVIVNTVPLFVYPLSIWANQEKFHLSKMFTLIIGILGMMFIVWPNTLTTIKSIPWTIVTLITPLSFAICAIYINKYRPKNVSSLQSAAGMLLSSSILITPVAFWTDSFYVINIFNFSITDLMVLLEIFLSSIAYIIFFKLLKTAGAVYYSLVGGIVTSSSLIWGYALYEELLSFYQIMAIVCIIFAITKISFSNNNTTKSV